jgi:hypothetical protein
MKINNQLIWLILVINQIYSKLNKDWILLKINQIMNLNQKKIIT